MKTALAAAALLLQAASSDPKFEEFKKEAFRKEAADVKKVQAEILASLSEANRCKKPEPE